MTYFHTLWCLSRFHLFEAPKKNVRITKTYHPPSPPVSLTRQGLKLCFVKLLTYAISISLTIETHKNNIDIFRVTSKQYYKTMLFYKFLSNEVGIFSELVSFHQFFKFFI